MEWWIQGHSFYTDMLVLNLAAYDCILGYDWLKTFSPITHDWEVRTMEFSHKGTPVHLQGVAPQPLSLQEIAAESLVKWVAGNDIWAWAIVDMMPPSAVDNIPTEVQTVLTAYKDVFEEPKGLPPPRLHDHTIPTLPDAIPVNSRPYRYSPIHKDEIERQVKELLLAGHITHSTSPYASPVLLVQKKDGTWRFCVDYRKLNDITIKNRFPMPIIDEILDELAGTRYFTKLDMRSGYHQVRMHPADEHKTAFKTHHGHYQFKVMPFGLTNAPATFQCLMNDILGPFLRKFVLVFLDDILIYSATLEEHVNHLTQVFNKLREHQLYLKRSKCSFAQHELEYLGHIISDKGVATDASKTAAMRQWPTPTSVTELRGFLGLTGYYRKFVQNYGVLAKPLTQLLRKKQFCWTTVAQQAFDKLKQAMCSTPVLAIPDFSATFIVETDASDLGIGAVLMQKDQPVAFMSKALGPNHQKLSIYEKEFLALIMAVEKWRPYLQRQEFIIRTDHKSLSYLCEQNLQSDMQRKAMTRLMGLQFKVVYKKGKDNCAADALSRMVHLQALQAVSEVKPLWIQEVINSYATDSQAQEILARLAIKSPDEHGFSLNQGIIKFNNKVWIANNSALQTRVIAALHDSAIGGHSGSKATYHRVKQLFHWKGLKLDVETFVQQCQICQQAKHENTHPGGLLQPLPIPQGAWQDLSMDFVEGLPQSENSNSILVVVDRLTKYSHFIPLKHPFTAPAVAKIFLDQVVRLHGLPKSIVSDRDKIFTSTFWTNLFSLMKTKLLKSTSYHPQTDGQTERVNQCLEMYLRCAVHESPKQWKAWLPLAELWYNSTFHTSLGCSPFKALYGYEANLGLGIQLSQQDNGEAVDMLQNREAHLSALKQHLATAQNRMKIQADKGRMDRQFQIGEQVLLKLQPYAQQSVINRPYPKLAYKFYGPFTVLDKIGKAAYKLALPDESQVHPVFHVSQLKPFTANYTPVFSELPTAIDLSAHDLAPELLLDRRLVKKGSRAIPQVLVKWTGVPDTSATWEDLYVLQKRFPDAIAWGQATSAGGEGVTPAKEAANTEGVFTTNKTIVE
jgi:hypothetical protein